MLALQDGQVHAPIHTDASAEDANSTAMGDGDQSQQVTTLSLEGHPTGEDSDTEMAPVEVAMASIRKRGKCPGVYSSNGSDTTGFA